MPCDLNQIPGTQHEPKLLYYFTAERCNGNLYPSNTANIIINICSRKQFM